MSTDATGTLDEAYDRLQAPARLRRSAAAGRWRHG